MSQTDVYNAVNISCNKQRALCFVSLLYFLAKGGRLSEERFQREMRDFLWSLVAFNFIFVVQ